MDSDGLCGHQQESTVRGPTGLTTGNWAGEETFNTPLETLASNGAAFHRKAPPHLESVETCRMKERVSSSTSFSLQGGTMGLYIAASSNRMTASIYNCFFFFPIHGSEIRRPAMLTSAAGGRLAISSDGRAAGAAFVYAALQQLAKHDGVNETHGTAKLASLVPCFPYMFHSPKRPFVFSHPTGRVGRQHTL